MVRRSVRWELFRFSTAEGYNSTIILGRAEGLRIKGFLSVLLLSELTGSGFI